MSDTTLPAGDQGFRPPEDPDGPFQPGARVGGRYTIEERIGIGGMGVVYRARQDLTDKRVALKVIRSGQTGGLMLDRFLDEIRLLGRLEHHGLASIHDADLHSRPLGGDVLFFTMDLVKGVPITTWVRRKNLDHRARLSLLIRVCEAMQYAHDHGVIHCDLKPANILVRESGDPVVIDFGLAYLHEQAVDAGAASGGGVPDGLGLGRGFAGTPSYMSPEQFQGGVHELRAGQSVDVYALGVIAFELLAERLPYDLPPGPTFPDLRRAVLFTPARRLAECLPDIYPELDRIIAKALRKDPADRYFSVTQFLHALSRSLPSATPAPDDVWRPAVGQTIPSTNWILDEKLGEGGVGEVWTCHHRSLKNKRIVKFCTDEEKASFLRRELTLYRLLKERVGQNPHFARLEEVALDEPPRYLMSEFIEARDFSKWCAAHGGAAGIPQAALLEIIAQAADALQAAHDAGVIHRDVKPSNLLVRGEPADVRGLHVWVGDFGIGQVVSEDMFGDTTRSGFTRTLLGKDLSSYSGTHLYMAPELLRGGEASVRSDIYALGVVLYQALAGDFHRAVTIDWASDIPDTLLRADIGKCFARDPAARFPSAAQLADHLRRLPERHHQRERAEQESALRERRAYRRGLARAGVVAAGVIAVVATLAAVAWDQRNLARHQTNIATQKTDLATQKTDLATAAQRATLLAQRATLLAQGDTLLGEAAALRRSPTKDRREKAWARLKAIPAEAPPSAKDRIRHEAVSILALPTVARTRVPSLEKDRPRWVSPGLSYGVSLADHQSFLLLKRQGDRWEEWKSIRRPPRDVSRLVVSERGSAIAAVFDEGPSVAINLQGQWREIAWETTGCVAVADRAPTSTGELIGIAAVARPGGTIEVFSGDQPDNQGLLLGADRAGGTGNMEEPPAPGIAPAWPRARTARALAFDTAGRRLAVASAESTLVLVWDATNGRLLAAGDHTHAVTSVAWNPEAPSGSGVQRTPDSENALVTGTEAGVVTVWDLDRRKGLIPADDKQLLLLDSTRHIFPVTPQKVSVRRVCFADAGQQVTALYDNDSIAYFHCNSGDFVDSIEVPSDCEGFSAGRFDPLLALSLPDHRIEFRRTGNPPILRESKVLSRITSVDSDSQGQLLLARGQAGAALIDPLHLRVLQRLDQAYGFAAQFNPETDHLLAISGGQFWHWERIANQPDPRTVQFIQVPGEGVATVVGLDTIAVSPGVRLGVVSAGNKLTVRRSDSVDRREFDAVPEGTTIRHQRFHPTGEWVVVIANGSAHPSLVDVAAETFKPLDAVPVSNYLDLAFSPDKRFLALRDARAVFVLSASTWEPVFDPIKLPSRVAQDAPIAFSHDSSMFAACGADAVPFLYLVPASGEEPWKVAARLEGPHLRDATSMRFGGPGHSCLLIGTADGYLQLWNIAELRNALKPVGLDWAGPGLSWPEDFVPCERVVISPPAQ